MIDRFSLHTVAHRARRAAWPCAGLAVGVLAAFPAAAQDVSINLGQGLGSTDRALQLVALLTILSLAPSILVMVTSFTRIVVVLSLLRTAIGTQTAPPNTVMTGLALFLTAFIMAPTFQSAYDQGIKPFAAGEIREQEAFERVAQPFRVFMLKHVRPTDLELFLDLSRQPRPATPDATPLTALVPAFMISELKRAFEIGFLLFIPFLIIDLVVSSILISMGMMMVPPVTVALPFKLIFFVLVDGWRLIAGSLVQSFGTL
ncbi:FliP Flagellar biosynthesis pathway, component FliP [Rhabdaerophilaceae bacterium]